MKKNQLILFLVFACASVLAEEQVLKPTIKPYANIQFWNVYSQNFEQASTEVPDRFASYFRRGRVGLKGQVNDGLTYNIMCSFDYLGKSENLSSKGKVNANTISLWSAYFTYQPIVKSQWLMFTGGTFLPHLSRESVTSPWTTSSLDKGETSCYLRRFVTGKTNGICPGINIGGLGDIGKSHLLYNVAMISRQDNLGLTKTEWSPLFIGHIILTLGDKEWSAYKYCFSGNPLKKQTFVSLGVGGSTQGKTDVFESSSTYGADFLLMLKNFKLDGEYYWLDRENTTDYLATCFQFRGSYNFYLQKAWVLEPAVMICQFNGDDTYQDASFYDGEDILLDYGVNLISNKRKIKLSLHIHTPYRRSNFKPPGKSQWYVWRLSQFWNSIINLNYTIMETWNGYYSEAEAYYNTTVGAKKKGRPFGNLVYYNLIGLALEGFLTAMITKDGDLPEHSSISSMLRMLKKKYDVPESFIKESRFYNKFMNFCSLEVLETLEPTDEEIDRMIKFVADLKTWIDENRSVLVETC